MGSRKKIYIYALFLIACLICAITFLFINLSNNNNNKEFEFQGENLSVYDGIPSDAVAILDIKKVDTYAKLSKDTTSVIYDFIDRGCALTSLQDYLVDSPLLMEAPFVFSMHYSAKNSVALLMVVDVAGVEEQMVRVLKSVGGTKREYNDIDIYKGNGAFMAQVRNLFIASESEYVLESAIRHIVNSTSILGNEEFKDIVAKNGSLGGLYINFSQIGKFFSGTVNRDFLGFSDFFLRNASWGVLNIHTEQTGAVLNGELVNNGDASYFSSVFYKQMPQNSKAVEILPFNTVFYTSILIDNIDAYIAEHDKFLEVRKRTGVFNTLQSKVRKESLDTLEIWPKTWIKGLNLKEIVAAYCKFGEKCEWITLYRTDKERSFGSVLSSVLGGDNEIEVGQFQYPGYFASVFGKSFSYCNEQAICSIGEWHIIGPKVVLDEFANGNANFSTLEHYLNQTPAKKFIGTKANVKVMANLKQAGDSLLVIFKPYYSGLIKKSLAKNNFGLLTLDLANDENRIGTNIGCHVTDLIELPAERVKEDENGEAIFRVDSTIHVNKGPFKLRDVTLKSDVYLEQLPNMFLRYSDAKKKGIWSVPFDAPLCGMVEQIDLYKNGRLQMLFAAGNRLFLLDRTARYVRGYPAKLKKEVVLGPKVYEVTGNKEYSVMVLNIDNSISWYDVYGKPIKNWKDIKAPEFVKELPLLQKIGSKKYWVLRAPSQMYIYTLEGNLVNVADKKRKIHRDSNIEYVSGNVVKVMCTDDKFYMLDLVSGSIKKAK